MPNEPDICQVAREQLLSIVNAEKFGIDELVVDTRKLRRLAQAVLDLRARVDELEGRIANALI